MPVITDPLGLERRTPGAYTAAKAINSLPGGVKPFQIPVLLAGATQGYPYDVVSKQFTGEPEISPFRELKTARDVRALFGAGSDMAIAFEQATRPGTAGLPYAWCVCLSDLTRASAIVTSSGPTTQLTLYGKLFGVAPGWNKITWTGGVWTTTPWKHFSLLTANGGSSATRIYVADNSWIRAGMVVEVGDNNSTNVERTVVSKGQELSSTGQKLYWVELDDTLGAAMDTAQYAAVAYYDTTVTEVSDTFTTGAELFDFLNSSSCSYWRAKKESSYTGALPISISTATPLKDISAWSTVTDGTSPAPTASDVDDFITLMDDTGSQDLRAAAQAIPRLYLLAMSDSAGHAAMRDWAITQRTDGYAIQVVTGCAWGDTDLAATDSTNPTYRAGLLNSEDMILCAGGLDYLPAYLSTAAQVFGYRARGGISHNLTRDKIFGSVFERRWSETAIDTLLEGGVLAVKQWNDQTGTYYGIAQGLNTLQANDTAWNDDSTTCLAQQRDIVDFILLDQKLNCTGSLVGNDSVNKAAVRAIVLARATIYESQNLIVPGSFSILSVTLNSAANGWDVQTCFTAVATVDFITVLNNVLIGEGE
jgi:hypothetical protein